MSNSMLWIDFETGGLDSDIHSPLSFAMIQTRGDEIVNEWECQIRLDNMVVTQEALLVNKLDLTAPGLNKDEFKSAYLNILGDWFDLTLETSSRKYPLVGGHNVPFDLGFLRKLTDKKMYLSYHAIDTIPLAKTLQDLGIMPPSSLKLGHLLDVLGIQPDGELHGAMVDAKAAFKLYLKMKELIKGVQR
jgi:DNA polymerase III alpha subunit (gram-positive type)